MAQPILTSHQQDALTWLVTHLTEGTPLVALRGLAGTGKTTLIPALRAALEAEGHRVAVGSPTHRAAMILRRKGIADADTVHAHALTPYFMADYARACAWLGEEIPCHWSEDGGGAIQHDAVEEVPWLIYERVKPDVQKARNLKRYGKQYPVKRRLASLGIHGRDYFDGFGPKDSEGILIIDEASMVGSAMLALCQQAFPQVCLVGDPGQLAPVKDDAMLASVEGIDLLEVHRQAADSPIIQLAYRARQGEAFWRGAFSNGADIQATPYAHVAAFLDAPLIVWRNNTRIQCTHAIREALGFTRERLTVGEPLVCRSTNQEDRAVGFYNNGLYRILETDTDDPRHLVVEDALGAVSTIYAHLEELDGEECPARAIPFRFGYCLTAHTAQGGEWPTVYISMLDLYAYASVCMKRMRMDEIAQWTYTAITRAKEQLIFLTSHTFMPVQGVTMPPKEMKPPSAPMIGIIPETVLQLAPEEPDDIPDPVVPEGTAEVSSLVQEPREGDKAPQTLPSLAPAIPDSLVPLAHGFCQYVQGLLGKQLDDAGVKMARSVEQTTNDMATFTKGVLASNEHASYQLSDALAKMQEGGLPLLSPPYQAVLRVETSAGYPLSLTITKSTSGALIEELGKVEGWLQANGYKPGRVESFV